MISMKNMKCGEEDLVSDMIAPRKEKTKYLFGSVKVGERGQIVIPKEDPGDFRHQAGGYPSGAR